MNREEALLWIGRRVYAYTALHGTYYGTLVKVRIRKGQPWRGVVRIDEQLEPESKFARNWALLPGSEIEVGASSIKQLDDSGRII